MQAKSAAEDIGKKIPSGGDATSALKNAVPALPKVTPPFLRTDGIHWELIWLAGTTQSID